ncbi:MAG: hypothetical protein K2Z81_12260 [Cyanobacteria bacterium]|nr:hypothetical protein [Cyanobacteriota bacterium]
MEAKNILAFLGAEAKGVETLESQLLDPKTGMYSYSVMLDFLEREYYRWESYLIPFSLVIFDMSGPNFEKLPVDAVTTAFMRLGLVTKPPDIVGHFAGRDYAILLPGRRPAEAVMIATKALKTLNACALGRGLNKSTLNYSFGIAGLPDNGFTLDHLYLAAKTAQLQAREKPFPVQPWRGRPA